MKLTLLTAMVSEREDQSHRHTVHSSCYLPYVQLMIWTCSTNYSDRFTALDNMACFFNEIFGSGTDGAHIIHSFRAEVIHGPATTAADVARSVLRDLKKNTSKDLPVTLNGILDILGILETGRRGVLFTGSVSLDKTVLSTCMSAARTVFCIVDSDNHERAVAYRERTSGLACFYAK